MNPSIMVRLGRYKYHYFHGQDCQLFDLESDPDEWDNLADLADYAAVEADLKQLVLDHFEVEHIVPTMLARLEEKKIVRAAMHKNGTNWDYQPFFDATQQYMRASADDPYERK